jgi:hypothetical protein
VEGGNRRGGGECKSSWTSYSWVVVPLFLLLVCVPTPGELIGGVTRKRRLDNGMVENNVIWAKQSHHFLCGRRETTRPQVPC